MDNNTLIFGGVVLLVIVIILLKTKRGKAIFNRSGLTIDSDQTSRTAKVENSKRVNVNQDKDSKTEISGSEDVKINQRSGK